MNSILEVRKIDLWSLFKLAFFIYAFIGLIVGFFYLLMALFIGAINSAVWPEEFPRFGFLGGLLGIILIPFLAFLYGIMGSVFVTIGGWIYNVVASLFGGLKFKVSVLAPSQSVPVPGGGGTSDESRSRPDSGNNSLE